MKFDNPMKENTPKRLVNHAHGLGPIKTTKVVTRIMLR